MPIRRFKTSLITQNKEYGVTSGRIDKTISATGGTISKLGSYTYHIFNGNSYPLSAMTDVTYTLNVSRGGTIDYLIVGGGGSGGTYCTSTSRGGSGGNVQTGTTTIGNTPYTITVGAGGYGWTTVNNGRSSTAFGITASGGTANNRTGTGYNGTYVSNFSQFGDSGYFGGGGGQGINGYSGYLGGLGGGGQGGSNPTCGVNGCDGMPSTGGGGGGSNLNCNASGGGGSGVVIIRYLSSFFEYE